VGEGVRRRGPAAAAAGRTLTDPLVARLRAAGCVFAEDEARLLQQAAEGPELDRLVARRVAGEPLEYVLGWVEFDGFRYAVEPGVFVPRQRTVLLVREAAALAPADRDPVIVDLCCGCGALGASLVRRLGRGRLTAADVDAAAVSCAARNVEPLGGRVLRGDLFATLPDELGGRIDLLLANVPYVPTDAIALMPPEARDHEPAVALDGGDDGLDVFTRVAAGAADWLATGGSVLMEVSESQLPRARQILHDTGLAVRRSTDEETGATVVIGTRLPGSA
jgi:release factor glutamine methyltransferase